MKQVLGKTLIVIPAFNEEESVAAVIEEVFLYNPDVTCLVVNDGSTDLTSVRAADAGAIVANLPFNLGVGGAMRLGFKYALAHGFRNVVQVDADGQHPPADIRKLVEQLKSNDVVMGARFAGTGDYIVRGPRKWAMNALAGLLSKSAGVQLTDTTSGFRASGPAAVSLFAEHYPAEYLGDTVESLVIAARAGLKISQVPVHMRERSGGNPSHSPAKAALFLARVGIAMFFAFTRPKVTIKATAL